MWFPLRKLTELLRAVSERLTALDQFVREQFADGPAGPATARADLGLRLAVKDKPGTSQGAVVSMALAFNDRQFAEGTLIPSMVDQDGKTIVDPATGQPLDPSQIGIVYTSDNPAVVDVSESAGQAFKFKSGDPGAASVAVTIGPYPNGANVSFAFDCIVGNSAPGDPVVTVQIKDE